jgi:DNA-directed RNA polymerase subunit K/omega
VGCKSSSSHAESLIPPANSREVGSVEMLTFASSRLTKYERARLVSARVIELESNAVPCVTFSADDSLFDIASMEIDARALEYTLIQHLPGGRQNVIKLSDLPKDI